MTMRIDRSESLPGQARLLAKHQGFNCTVLFDIDKESGEVVAGDASNMPGIARLWTGFSASSVLG